jgi:hypothetical protein
VVGAISISPASLVAAVWAVMPLICVGAVGLRQACHTAYADAAGMALVREGKRCDHEPRAARRL